MTGPYPEVNGDGEPTNGVSHHDVFGLPEFKNLKGKEYVSGATILAEQVAYSLSSTIFQYGDGLPEDGSAVTYWSTSDQANPLGVVPVLERLQTRSGAGIFVLGHSALKHDRNRTCPNSVFATSATVQAMQPVLSELALKYYSFKPVITHVAAVDLDSTAHFVTDFVTPLRVARESNLVAIISKSSDEVQYVSILASLLATAMPTLHIYDGIRLARELTQVVNVLPAAAVLQLFETFRRAVPVTKNDNRIPQLTNLLAAFNSSLNTRFSFFEYVGHPAAETILVVLGSLEASLANAAVGPMVQQGMPIGIVSVRIYQPFSDAEFLVTIPRTTEKIAVLGQVDCYDMHSILYEDVLAAVVNADANINVTDLKYTKQHIWSAETFSPILKDLTKDLTEVAPVVNTPLAGPVDHFAKKYVFWDLDDSVPSTTARKIARRFAADPSSTISFCETYDNFSQTGILYSELQTGMAGSALPVGPIDFADIVVLSDVAIANSFDVVHRVAPGGKVLVKTSIKTEDLEKKLPAQFRRSLFSRREDIEVYTVNPKEIDQTGNDDVAEDIVIEIAFLKLVGWNDDIRKITKGTSRNGTDFATVLQYISTVKEAIDIALRKLEIPTSWSELENTCLPSIPRASSYSPNTEKGHQEPQPKVGTWHTAAQQIIFKESHGFQSLLRPELGMKNWIVRVQENKRLTPLNYDRNIFHIEFDLSGTDLTYNIGEALGVHGHNDEEQAEAFLAWYGLNPDAIISIPAKEYPGHYETRTVRQLFVQSLDIFGKPPKKFYEMLSEFATDEKQKAKLRALGGSDGSVEFKRRSEIETLTFADILEEFPSAKPRLEDLLRIVPPIKRREYSIASSQRVHPTSVHLLVVEVNWQDKKNRERYGQCTRYLSQLPIGAKVTVSVKPSVMKLPPDDTTPIIMAGLGTGLAPFRAFVQERALQRSLGREIGPVFLYMGSRHQREEYLCDPSFDNG